VRSRDYEEFIEFLNQLEARYLVVGAHAVAFHARPRATKDLDVFIEPTRENAELVLTAIRQFLGTDLGIKATDLSTPAPAGIRLPIASSAKLAPRGLRLVHRGLRLASCGLRLTPQCAVRTFFVRGSVVCAHRAPYASTARRFHTPK
jgi:hypothetical protein